MKLGRKPKLAPRQRREARKPREVKYVDFGNMSAKQFWAEIVVPAYDRFKSQQSRGNAIDVSILAWHVHDWIWHESHPGEDTRDSINYRDFCARLKDDCPELAWISDVANAGKHRGLGLPIREVERMRKEERLIGAYGAAPYATLPYGGSRLDLTPLLITLTDGSEHNFAEILSRIMDYWQREHFP